MSRGGAAAIPWGCTEAQEGLRTLRGHANRSDPQGCTVQRLHGDMAVTVWHSSYPSTGDRVGIDSSWIRNQDSKCSCHTSCKMMPGVPCSFTFLTSNLEPRQGTQLSRDVVPCLAAREAGKVSILHFWLLGKRCAWLRELSSQKEQLPPGLEMRGWI